MNLFNTTILMTDADNFSTEQQINPYYGDSSVDIIKAKQEHRTIKSMLEDIGVTVRQVPSPSDSQDGIYTANWALVRGKKAVLSRLPNARKAEEEYAKKVLTSLDIEVEEVPGNFAFSGQGDALPCGNYLFCGKGYRSDEKAQNFAASYLGYDRIQLQTIPQLDQNGSPVTNSASGWPDSFFYDIDLALSIIKQPSEDQKGLIAYCPEAFTQESQSILKNFDKVDKIEIPMSEAKEAFAANLISTGESVVMSNNAPELSAKLKSHGLKILSPDISELVKGGGYIRCTTLTIN